MSLRVEEVGKHLDRMVGNLYFLAAALSRITSSNPDKGEATAAPIWLLTDLDYRLLNSHISLSASHLA